MTDCPIAERIVRIDDPSDSRIADYRDIRERDLVGRRHLFVAEGKVVLEKLVRSPRFEPLSVLIAAHRIAAIADILRFVPDEVPIFGADQRVVDAIAGFPLHRGILAIGRRNEEPQPEELLDRLGPDATVLFLSAIANHDNMGGLFRNAAAFEVDAVLIDSRCCDPLYRKSIRVSVGAALLVPYARIEEDCDPIELLEARGFELLALTPGGATDLADVRAGARTAVFLGAEGPGLSNAILDRVKTVRIAMSAGFDSLNVATTSGIVLHHLNRR